jgi:hypothetical protein
MMGMLSYRISLCSQRGSLCSRDGLIFKCAHTKGFWCGAHLVTVLSQAGRCGRINGMCRCLSQSLAR